TFLQLEHKLKTLAITCAHNPPLESLAAITLKLTSADEKSMVMTRSFTSMLLGLQYQAATISNHRSFRESLVQLSTQVSPIMDQTPAKLREFLRSLELLDFVFLAQGPLFGIANEAMLKTMESSSSYAQVFHSMEFRHGPKSIAGPKSLITFLISESSYKAEMEVLVEMKELGSPVLAIANALDTRARTVADLSIELGLDAPEYARLAAYTIWGQLLGVYMGMKNGRNPDAPKNLSRSVILDGQHG